MTNKITEKFLEDWVCKYPQRLHLGQIVGRQVRLPHGIADLIAVYYTQTIVVELKAVPIQEQHIAQVLRYKFDIERLLRAKGTLWHTELIKSSPQSFVGQEFLYQWRLATRMIEPNEYEDPSVMAWLVGESIEDKVLAAASVIPDLEIKSWHYFPDQIDEDLKFDIRWEDYSCRNSMRFLSLSCLDQQWLLNVLKYQLDSCAEEAIRKLNIFCYDFFDIPYPTTHKTIEKETEGDNHISRS